MTVDGCQGMKESKCRTGSEGKIGVKDWKEEKVNDEKRRKVSEEK